MKIIIPEEYRDHFQKKKMWIKLKDPEHSCATKEYSAVFVTRWKDDTLRLLNEDEYDRLVATFESISEEMEDGGALMKFLIAGIHTAVMTQGAIEIPDYLAGWFGKDEYTVTKEDTALLVK